MNKKKIYKNTLWRDSWAYLKESRNYVYSAVILFLAGTIIGFAFPEFFSQYFDGIIKDLVEKTAGFGLTELVFFIFQNNTLSALGALFMGILFGVIPVINITVNGALLGYVLARAVEVEGFITIWRIIPHGIFELPAIFISVGLGIKIGLFWFEPRKTRAMEFKRRFWRSIQVFFMIILPLLIIAAIIEGFLIALSG